MQGMELTDLYGRFGASVYRRALLLLGNAEEARDVTHDAFASMVEQWGRLRSHPANPSLLHQMATCLAIDRLRQRGRWRDGQPYTEPSHPGDMRRAEAAKDLALLLHGESPQTLSAAVLHFVDGHSITEVATHLGLSSKTVRHQLRRFVDRARKRSVRLDGKT
ncbi:hypothetical protein DRW03_28550 [Corallococcus sp. H22C18031201]|uniref:RNA polymerase sigma factor n=1 Tax=Citreicoccus inhibens TaxID=2849499 RepID=UPI000E737327|nr:RNA polymerase sigma factor [Citreicoccus inhibens]MBU8897905.1 RNA polymerase sigma factor [Citreicoccus inhibens]RJS17021.1 hypothetical protein DRW03_28550 [Corallococcus sp. H22C18031201]